MELTQARSEVVADQGENTLHLVLRGRPTPEEANRLAVEAVTSARHLDTGFTLVTDTSALGDRSNDVVEPLVRARDQLREMACGRMVSVVAGESAEDPTRGDHRVETTTSLAATAGTRVPATD
jgi:hypothetical protein